MSVGMWLRRSLAVFPVMAALIIAAVTIAGSQHTADGAKDALALDEMLRAAILAF